MCAEKMDPLEPPAKAKTKTQQLEDYLNRVTTETSPAAQQKLLKELLKRVETTDDARLIANLMSKLFLTVDPKSPLKKTVSRILLTMQEGLVVSAMAAQIVSLIKTSETGEKLDRLANQNNVLISLNACFNNFPPGVEALSKIINLVFIFACNIFLKSVRYSFLEGEGDKQTLHVYIYNGSKFLVALLNQCDISEHMTEHSFKILLACYKIITNEHIGFNTKANCGILLVMAAIHTPEKENDENGVGLANLLKLETEGGGSLLANTLLLSKNYTAKICIFSGILNTVPHEVICADKLDDVPAPIYIFQSLLESASKQTGKPLEIMEISRTFILLSRLLFNMDFEDIEVIYVPGLEYIWTHIDHFIDTVRHDTITVLKNFVKIAVQHEKNGHKRLIQAIIAHVSETLANNNSNYKALSIISNETTCDYLLNIFPDLPTKLLENLKNNSVAQQVCTTYETLMEQYSKEQPNKWINVWIKKLLPTIHTCGNGTYGYYQKIFTVGFKIDQSIIKFLSSGNRTFNNPNELGVLLGCFITARKMNTSVTFYKEGVSGTLWNGMLEYDLLDILMCHQTPDIRISTLTLIIECQKTTQIFPKWDLNYLVRFLHYNITTQMPNVRQQVISLYKKAFTRYKESLYVIERNIKTLLCKMKAVEKGVEKMQEALKAYKVQESYYKGFIVEIFEKELMKGLLTDVNYYRRSVALELLLYIKTCVDGEDFGKLWKKDYVILLYQALNDSYESNIIMASKLLLELPKTVTYYQTKAGLKEDIKNTIILAASIKPTSTMSAAYRLQVYKNAPLALEVLCEVQGISPQDKEKSKVPSVLLTFIIEQIGRGLDVAKDNVLIASKYAPIYGLIFCMRHLIQKEHFEDEYPEFVPQIIELCNKVSRIASPIVNSSSPEGFMPTDNEHITDETVTSQMILVYAWRTVKEISLLLGELSFKKRNGEQIIPLKSLIQIADYFITIFMETKHRGAYEQAYLGFSKFCSKLWNSDGKCSEWPVNWLNTILERILNGKQDNFDKLCSTRRSAGVPFVIQAILTTEPQSRGHESFHYCMATLLEIAGGFSGHEEKAVKASIHSMNILRALYKHNQLGEMVTSYVAKGVMIAILGFSYPAWGVRNAATLMFSALMTRIFGVQRTKDSEEISIKNRLSARVFFMRYPELRSFILDTLKVLSNKADNISLYPLLFILARLFPSSDKSEMLQYLPFINHCLGSRTCKMRELAAQASISAIPTDEYVDYIVSIFADLHEKMSGNLMHGTLLQLKLLLKYLPSKHKKIDVAKLVESSYWIIEKAGTTISHVAAKEYMEIVISIISSFKEQCYGREEFVNLMNVILQSMEQVVPLSTAKTNFELTRTALYLHLLANILDIPIIYREKCLKDFILGALYKGSEDMQIFALNFIKYLFDTNYLIQNLCVDFEEEDEKSELEYKLVKGLSVEMEVLVMTAISYDLECHSMFTDLFHIFNTRRKNYSLKVCSMLPYFPCVINRIRPKNVPVVLNKQLILDFLVRECTRMDTEMFCVILPLITTLVCETKDKIDYSLLIKDVLKRFSTPESSLEERFAVTNFLVQNSGLLHGKGDLLLADQIEIWYIVFTLLQDNDEVVRDQISTITNFFDAPFSSFFKRWGGMYVISERSLEELIQIMPQMIPCEEAMKMYVTLALKTKCPARLSGLDSAEVFDKGELNIYEEGDPVALLALKSLKKYLWAVEDELSYKDNSILVEEHVLLAATRLLNVFNNYHACQDKLLSMLVLKEVINYLEVRSVRTGNFKKDFKDVLEKKFMSIFSQNPKVFKYCRVGAFLKCVFSFVE